MNQVEKEIMALNLLSLNSIAKIGLTVEGIHVIETVPKKNHIVHTITLPDRLISVIDNSGQLN